MKQRSQRGAARVSAIWIIVFLVLMLVAAAFGWISQQEAAQARADQQAAEKARATAEERFNSELEVSRNISEIAGFMPPDTAGGRTNLDAAKDGLETLKSVFTQMDSTVATYEDAVPVAIAQYNAAVKNSETLQNKITDLESTIESLRSNITQVSSQKDDQIRTLQQQLTDAENQARDDQSGLENRLAAATADRNDKDSQLRSVRGNVDDLSRQAEKDKIAATTRFNQLSSKLAFMKEGQAPDGEVLAVSEELGIGWINLGAKHRLSRGTVFHVVPGTPGATTVKGWARVTNVGEARSEVEFFDIADPFSPIVPRDIVYNPVFDPHGRRNAVLVGRFSGTYNEKELQLLLNDIGITVQKRLDLDTDYLIVGAEVYVDEEGDPVEEPIQPSELSVYKDALELGTQIVSIRDIRRYFKK